MANGERDEFHVHWYPGHMAKARRQLRDHLKKVDFLIEVADARAPQATRNPELDELLADRPRLLVLAKEDLAEPGSTRQWLNHLNNTGVKALAASLLNPSDIRRIKEKVYGMCPEGNRQEGGALSNIPGLSLPDFGARRWRGLVVGMPNTGKSTLIRALGGGGVATGDRPGVTRGMQEFGIGRNLLLLDTPGLMWPKVERGSIALHIVWVGCVSEAAYDEGDAAGALLKHLIATVPHRVTERYGPSVGEFQQTEEALRHIAERRGRFSSEGGDLSHAARTLLYEFRKGLLGRVTLDDPPAAAGA